MKRSYFVFFLWGLLILIIGIGSFFGYNTAVVQRGPDTIFGWRFDIAFAIVLIAVSPALYFAGRSFRKKGRSVNLTWIVLPIGVLIWGWYMVATLCRFIFAPPEYPPGLPIGWWVGVILQLVLPTAAFSYAMIKRVQLEFKWSALSIAGMIVVVYFGTLAVYQFFDPTISNFSLGTFDHVFYPIAIGLLALCDLKMMPQAFWLILLMYSVQNLTVIASAISSLVFNHLLFGSAQPTLSPSNFLPFYFGVESRAELASLPLDRIIYGSIIAVREVLFYMVFMQAMNFYYLVESIGKKRVFIGFTRTWASFVLSIVLMLLGWGALALVTGQTDHALWDPNNRPPPGIPLTFPYRVPGIIMGAIGAVIFTANIYYFFRNRSKAKQNVVAPVEGKE